MKNVILLTIDTLRRDVLGCYGNKQGLTPSLDAVSKKSAIFTNLQSIAPYTQASFPGILTSSYYLDHEDHGRGQTLSPDRTIISEHLQKNGIVTAGFHSNPYISEFFGWNRGWDVFYDSMDAEVTDEIPYIKGDAINAKVRGWLKSHAASPDYKPFFLWTHYMDIHEPYIPARQYVDKVDPSIKLTESEMFNLFKTVILPRDASNPETVETLKRLYLAHIIEVDEYVREFFDILKAANVLKDSIVIITSDHGDEFNEHGGLSHDGKMYGELINVPLLIYEETRNSAATCPTLVSNVDISPTIVYLFGLSQAEKFQGRSLLPLETYPEKGCFGEAMGKKGRMKETDKPVYFYREKNLKIVYHEEKDQWEMYDLKTDPAEKNNIVKSSPLAKEMKAKLSPRIGRQSRH